MEPVDMGTSLGGGVLLDRPAFVSLAENFDQRFVVARVSGADPVTPFVASVALSVGLLALVNLLSVVPGWRGSRRAPGATLRAE